MRTVTFSDPDVAAVVNEKFVAAWHNRGPGFRNNETRTEQHIFESTSESFPTKNICTFFLTPDGRVLHYIAGYVAPSLFRDALQLSLEIRERALDEAFQLREGGLDAVRGLHRARADIAQHELEKPAGQWERTIQSGNYGGKEHKHTGACAQARRQMFSYLARLHTFWGNVAELPALADVRYRYVYGNDFSEEPKDTPRIENAERPKKR